MVALEWLVAAGLSSFIIVQLINWMKERQQQQRLQQAFYTLLTAQESCITLIQLTATASVDALIARLYLDQQLKLLDGTLDVDEEGNTFYRFPKLHPPFQSTDVSTHD
jgi:type II secretory pathway component PulK